MQYIDIKLLCPHYVEEVKNKFGIDPILGNREKM